MRIWKEIRKINITFILKGIIFECMPRIFISITCLYAFGKALENSGAPIPKWLGYIGFLLIIWSAKPIWEGYLDERKRFQSK